MTAANSAMAERCFDTTVRVERIVHLATMAADEAGDLFDWLEEDCAELLTEVLGHDLEEILARYGSQQDSRREALREALVDKPAYGWIVDMATPVMTPNAAGTSASFSWGQYRTRPFYGETYEEALEKGFTWAESTQPVITAVDREPQPGDGPDYPADHAAWSERLRNRQAAD